MVETKNLQGLVGIATHSDDPAALRTGWQQPRWILTKRINIYFGRVHHKQEVSRRFEVVAADSFGHRYRSKCGNGDCMLQKFSTIHGSTPRSGRRCSQSNV